MATLLLGYGCTGKQPRTTATEEAPQVLRVDSVDEDSTLVDEQERLITDTPMPRAADELFDDFLFNFSANKQLQMERIAYPLPVTRNGQTEYVERGQWKMEHFFMRQGYYTLLFDSRQQMEVVKDTSVSRALVERIYFNTGAVQQYQFKRINGAWMLMEVKTDPITANRNASFLEFYHQFVTDSVFQVASLNESVAFEGPDPDDDFAQMEGVITADTWPAFAPELPVRMIYNIVYGEPRKPTAEKIFVMRGIANGLEQELTFRLVDGQWKLVKFTA